ncbi:MAG TPA: SRPBCC family protein [Usitatibacter sp.]|jgi:uncharacterized protein YndB with AHSA1/START domain|nr:SRPBCC family protein [Usitatibacter sp.]
MPDRIEKAAVLHAPLARVWDAVSESSRFGSWFGVEFDGPFVEGRELTGRIVPTTVDPEVAKLQEPHRGKRFAWTVERIEPPRRIAFRWHPFAIDASKDYSAEPMTLVAFELEEAGGGTRLTITESGFDRLPAERRDEAYRANEGGWTHQLALFGKYLAQA